jgi:hypothetical protein
MVVFDDPDLLNKRIVIESMDHLRILFRQGFEISSINISWDFKGGQNTDCILSLRKGNDRLLADAGKVAEYVIQLKYLPDFEKKKNSFIPVSDSELYFSMELKFIDIALGDHRSPISTGKVDIKNPQVVYQQLCNWIQQNVKLKQKNSNLPQLFSSVFIINILGDEIAAYSHPKDSLDLFAIQRFLQESHTYNKSLAVSFILLAEKNPNPSEMLVCIILYDLQDRNTVCFNIECCGFQN